MCAALAGVASAALLCPFWTPRADALEPMSHFHDLVAGDGVGGYRDGAFYRARFQDPSGLAVLSGGTLLAVADPSNNRIRGIRLDDGNRVETLAGSGAPGDSDGPLLEARFNRPGAVVAISDHAFLVSDEITGRLRKVDLAAKTVETMGGSGGIGVAEGPARKVALGGISSLAFSPAEKAVFLAQPDSGALRRLDLATWTVRTILRDDPRVPRPQVLAFFRGRLCIADESGRVVGLEQTAPGFSGERVIHLVGTGKNILSMTESGDNLYAIQGSDPGFLRVDTGASWLPAPVLAEATHVPYLRFGEREPAALVVDPRSARSFFLSAPMQHEIVCVKDYRFGELRDKTTTANGLVDFDYPAKKSAGTFRILMVGDSRVNYFFEAPGGGWPAGQRMETAPKRLELMLNTLAALEGSRTRYEVLTLTRVSWLPLLVWSVYLAPEAARTFDADLVLLMEPPGGGKNLEAYLERPITERGIPAAEMDMEYLLKPLADRLRGNPAATLVERAQARGWVRPVPNEEGVAFERIPVLETDPPSRAALVDLYARLVRELHRSLEIGAGSPKGLSRRLVFCYFLFGGRGDAAAESPFWRDVAAAGEAEFLDLTDPFVALRESWYPLSEATGNDHFTAGGHAFLAFLLSHELVRSGMVPMKPPAP